MNGSLDALIAFITKHYPFVPEKYPQVDGLADAERQHFAIRHLSQHFSKTAGKITAAVEPADHGREMDMEEIRANLPKSLVNTLRLAQLVGMDEKALIAGVERMYGDSFSK
ncbi:MAG TPA: hypothetical protein VEB18_02235 [Candidatus Paceibacterota bacterium]|nr:hypothetical protein [Candidatus Paceibacterota bacterium]